MAVSRVAALCGSAGIALFALTGSAFAEDKFGWSATLTGTSDYVFRGISQTNNDPTIQGSLGATYGLFYAGWWASGLDWNPIDPKAQVEMDWYAGFKPTWGKATFDFGVIYYSYPGSLDVPGFGSTSILELKSGVSGEILPKLTAGVTYYYAPDINNFDYGVVEATLAYALPKTWVFDPSRFWSLRSPGIVWHPGARLQLLECRPHARCRQARLRLPLLGHRYFRRAMLRLRRFCQ